MNDSAKWIEIALIALGIIATLVIGYGQYNIGEQQNKIMQESSDRNKNTARQNAEIQILQLLKPHLDAFSKCSASKSSQKMVAVSSDYLTTTYESTEIAKIAELLSEECPEGNLEQTTVTRIKEATVPLEKQNTKKWFTVIASYSIENDAKQSKLAFIEKVQEANFNKKVEVYKTKISQHFALVLGGSQSKSEAIALAKMAQKNEIASDAFAQVDRDWKKVNW